MHLLIPFARPLDPTCIKIKETLKLTNLEQLLKRLTPLPIDTGSEHSFDTPHERALAKLAAAAGHTPIPAAQARITPCHWQVGQGQVIMGHPDDLALTDAESRILLSAMQPYFAEDGITLEFESPTCWRARGEVFRNLSCASLDRVIGHNIDDWLTKTSQAEPLHRLQNEMQMLLYTHPLNDERAERGALTVNSFWVCRFTEFNTDAMGIVMPVDLMQAAQRQDWAAWKEGWQRIDATHCATLLSSNNAQLTLCGERSAQTFSDAPRSLWAKAMNHFGSKPLSKLLSML